MNEWTNERVNDGRVRGKESVDAHLKEASKDLWRIEMTDKSHFSSAKDLCIPNICCTLCSVKGKKVIMPTLFTLFGCRFMFYSNDHEPIHVMLLKTNMKLYQSDIGQSSVWLFYAVISIGQKCQLCRRPKSGRWPAQDRETKIFYHVDADGIQRGNIEGIVWTHKWNEELMKQTKSIVVKGTAINVLLDMNQLAIFITNQKKSHKHLQMSKICSTFAAEFK